MSEKVHTEGPKLRVAFEMETTMGMEEGDDSTSERQIKVYWVGIQGATEPAGQIMTTSVVAKWLADQFGSMDGERK